MVNHTKQRHNKDEQKRLTKNIASAHAEAITNYIPQH